MCAQVAPSGECLWGKCPLIKCWQNLGAICFWQPIPTGLNLVVAAVLRDSLCVVSLLSCMADCCMLYTVCKVEQFVLTIIKRRLLLFLLLFLWFLHRQWGPFHGSSSPLAALWSGEGYSLHPISLAYDHMSAAWVAHLYDCVSMPTVLVTGPTVTQNWLFLFLPSWSRRWNRIW